MNAFHRQAIDSRALGVAVAIHVAAMAAAFGVTTAPDPRGMPPSLRVSLHAMEATPIPEMPAYVPPPPRVVPTPAQELPPPPVLAVPDMATVQRTVEAEPPKAKPEPEPRQVVREPVKQQVPALAEPAPTPAPVAVSQPTQGPATTPASAPAPKPMAVVPPRFDADYLHNPAPIYPHMSRRLREQGKVLLRVMVTPDGQPAEIEVRESSGYPRLDQAALESVQRWRFVPARQGDKGVSAWVLVPISYSIRS